ncbi:CPBP family intramembrane glutamic endopeptidase [Cohnella hashimotonis]|uniref:Type II CAAX endopeptidase family protein n=1 Tax=Cohnella hashimotonis TaxID=2826895 RepID=A0ABT6TF29_9BACL|nr:type II CAAX endopeptidase family protein [Cohnella hashimotonis]MDI4645448.1 type II CAAX endopeptidase family protein [Cohnella hashimotonis]
MPKFDIKNVKLRKVTVDELSDKMLLINLYATQALTFIIGLAWVFFQGQNILEIFRIQGSVAFLYWAAGLAALVVAFDIGISRWIPDEAKDDGGVNERIFRNRPLWHIVLLCAVVSICEELLFRGAIQHSFGPYWTSIIFAAIHVRYLRHWIPTGMVFAISYGLGLLLTHTGTIWAPVFTHFLVDLTMGIIIKYRREEGE